MFSFDIDCVVHFITHLFRLVTIQYIRKDGGEQIGIKQWSAVVFEKSPWLESNWEPMVFLYVTLHSTVN